jgi:hypothetical protein
VWSGRPIGRLALGFGAAADVLATRWAGAFAGREDFAGVRLDAARLSREGFPDAFAGLFVARVPARAGRVEVRCILAFLLAFFLAERTVTLGLRRLAARRAEGRLFAFFAMTV